MKIEDKRTLLESYLAKPLVPFRRGDGDCVAFCKGWVNELLGESSAQLFQLLPQTFGDVKRSLNKKSLTLQVEEELFARGFQERKKPNDGDIVTFSSPDALEGIGLGIFKDGKAITRIAAEKPALYIEPEPEILKIWKYC